ncbi:hypothetical protein [Streptomyces apocyni]|uniref:hypothetical protein n=1 Tax=Streptomyces apocyni TaxID=2654677 RepID=UPI001E5A61FF|nr:hypothetical protein [Streptomyces apocyni]
MTAARPLLRTTVRTTARTTVRTTIAGLALAGVTLAGAPAAVAAPGDNGDVKIHKEGTPTDDPRNEPKVCKFYLAAFNFDTLQEVTWEIVPQPMKNDGASLDGSITLATGTGHTDTLTLPNGMYKLTWTFEGASGAGKMKVFQVDCPPNGNGNGKPPNGGVGAGGGGAADTVEAASATSPFSVGTALAAGVAGTAGLIFIRRSRRRNDGAA